MSRNFSPPGERDFDVEPHLSPMPYFNCDPCPVPIIDNWSGGDSGSSDAPSSSDAAPAPGPAAGDSANWMLSGVAGGVTAGMGASGSMTADNPGATTVSDQDGNINAEQQGTTFGGAKGMPLADLPPELQLANSLLGLAPNADPSDPGNPFDTAISDVSNGFTGLGMIKNVKDMIPNAKEAPKVDPGDGSGPESDGRGGSPDELPETPENMPPADGGPGAQGLGANRAPEPTGDGSMPHDNFGGDAPDPAKYPSPTDGTSFRQPDFKPTETVTTETTDALSEFLDTAGDVGGVVAAFQGGWQYGESWDKQVKADGSAGKDASGQNRSWSDKEGDDGWSVHNWVKSELGGGTAGDVAGTVAGMATTFDESVIGTGKAIRDLPGMLTSSLCGEAKDVMKGDEQEEAKLQADHPLLSKALGYVPGATTVTADMLRQGDALDQRAENLEKTASDYLDPEGVAAADAQNRAEHPVLQTIEDATGVGLVKDEIDAHQKQIDDVSPSTVVSYLDGSAEYKAAAKWMDIDVSKWPI